MFNLRCAVLNSVSALRRQLVTPLNASVTLTALFQVIMLRSFQFQSCSYFPPLPGQESTLRWAGKKFEELPIVHIKATYNNTHIQLSDSAGQSLVRTSCGTEGFKNIKKSTPIAAQTAGISAAAKATAKGVTFVRVVVKGLGPGRLSAIKGLTMGGLQVVSITDNTPVPHNGCRPRKARRM
uniref:Small ribosomal subunit protein uS11m n=1 Tax=Cyprinodon variegatus TaxID=28743 RepID=A0A3Q2FVA8_CYPVA